MRIAHIADVHVQDRRRGEYAEVFKRLVHTLRELVAPPDVIVVAGDVYDAKTRASAHNIADVGDFLAGLAGVAPVVLIAGNHDTNVATPGALDLLAVTVAHDTRLRPPHLHFFRGSGEYDAAGVRWIIAAPDGPLPSRLTSPPGAPDALDAPSESPVVCIFHEEVASARLPSGVALLAYRLTPTSFDNVDAALGGHIHLRQRLGTRGAFCGSLLQQNFGECHTRHGFAIWNVAHRAPPQIEFVDIESPRGFVRVRIDARGCDETLRWRKTASADHSTDIGARLPDPYAWELVVDPAAPAAAANAALAAYSARWRMPPRAVRSVADLPIFADDSPADYAPTLFDWNPAPQPDSPSEPAAVRVPDQEPGAPEDATAGLEAARRAARDPEAHARILGELLTEAGAGPETTAGAAVLEMHRVRAPAALAAAAPGRGRVRLVRLAFDDLYCYGPGNVVDFTRLEGRLAGAVAPNRAGKSSLVDALIFALYDEAPRASLRADIIRRGATSYRVELDFELDGQPGRIVKAARGRTGRNALTYRLEFAGEDLTGASAPETAAAARRLLGGFADAATTAFATSGAGAAPGFADMAPADRKARLVSLLALGGFASLEREIASELTGARAAAAALRSSAGAPVDQAAARATAEAAALTATQARTAADDAVAQAAEAGARAAVAEYAASEAAALALAAGAPRVLGAARAGAAAADLRARLAALGEDTESHAGGAVPPTDSELDTDPAADAELAAVQKSSAEMVLAAESAAHSRAQATGPLASDREADEAATAAALAADAARPAVEGAQRDAAASSTALAAARVALADASGRLEAADRELQLADEGLVPGEEPGDAAIAAAEQALELALETAGLPAGASAEAIASLVARAAMCAAEIGDEPPTTAATEPATGGASGELEAAVAALAAAQVAVSAAPPTALASASVGELRAAIAAVPAAALASDAALADARAAAIDAEAQEAASARLRELASASEVVSGVSRGCRGCLSVARAASAGPTGTALAAARTRLDLAAVARDEVRARRASLALARARARASAAVSAARLASRAVVASQARYEAVRATVAESRLVRAEAIASIQAAEMASAAAEVAATSAASRLAEAARASDVYRTAAVALRAAASAERADLAARARADTSVAESAARRARDIRSQFVAVARGRLVALRAITAAAGVLGAGTDPAEAAAAADRAAASAETAKANAAVRSAARATAVVKADQAATAAVTAATHAAAARAAAAAEATRAAAEADAESRALALRLYRAALRPAGGLTDRLLELARSELASAINGVLAESTAGFSVELDSDFALRLGAAAEPRAAVHRGRPSTASPAALPASLASGFQRFAIDLAARVALWRLAEVPLADCLFIDEGFGVCDETNLDSVADFVAGLAAMPAGTAPRLVFAVSHLEAVKARIECPLVILPPGGPTGRIGARIVPADSPENTAEVEARPRSEPEPEHQPIAPANPIVAPASPIVAPASPIVAPAGPIVAGPTADELICVWCAQTFRRGNLRRHIESAKHQKNMA